MSKSCDFANSSWLISSKHRYQLEAICDCAEACLRALLNEQHLTAADQVRDSEFRREPNQSASEVLHEVANLAGKLCFLAIILEPFRPAQSNK